MTANHSSVQLDPIMLPAAEPAPAPRRMPFLAAAVPILGGLAMWFFTRSPISLVFAALGPLMLVASQVDARRTRRKHDRATARRWERQWHRAEAERDRAHAREREAFLREHPDAVAAATMPLSNVEAPSDALQLVLGRGSVPSALTVTARDESDETRDFVARCRMLDEAPVPIGLGTSLHIVGVPVITAAVVRGLIAQLLMRTPAGTMTWHGDFAETLGVSLNGAEYRVLVTADPQVSARQGEPVWLVTEAGEATPAGFGAVLDVQHPLDAILKTREGVRSLCAEAVSAQQLERVIERTVANASAAGLPSLVELAELPRQGSSGSLLAPLGLSGHGPIAIDLVADGPHAVVTGVTGTGKSELLCSWIASMAREYSPAEVNFVLADFKGGMAFEPLKQLPHTAAVITDLDHDEVTRGVQSLRAEMRRRSALLAEHGAREVGGLRSLPRLVIVVDEFAAMMQEHTELAAVFTDIAARGRALGMHLVLGTQRATGAVRDALLGNCPLRICLRAADAAESRYVLGSDVAALLPGGVEGRGLAEIMRAGDSSTTRVRIALTPPATLTQIARDTAATPSARSPWLAALPNTLTLETVRDHTPASTGIILGLSDEPAHQRQQAVVLDRDGRGVCIAGGVGSGKTTALAAILQQRPDAVVVPSDLEAAWQLVCGAGSSLTGAEVVLCDDFDVRTAQLSPEQAVRWVAAWEQLIRRSAASGGFIALTVGRMSGNIARVVELLPRRAILPTSARSEHLALGGEGARWRADRAPGRAEFNGLETQLVMADATSFRARETAAPLAEWKPTAHMHGLVTPPSPATLARLTAAYPGIAVVAASDFALAPGEASLVVGDAEQWLRQPTLLQRVRSEGTLLIPAAAPALLRTLGGYAEGAPYLRNEPDRVWEVHSHSQPRIGRMPALEHP